MSELDDAAAAALYMLSLEQDKRREHMGLIYGDDYRRTPTVTSGAPQSVRGTFKVPSGSLRALFHNHPIGGDPRNANPRDRTSAQRFSDKDMENANRLKVPSYISAGDEVRRYDPGEFSDRGTEVLAQFPWDEFRAYLMRKHLDRAPDDPRGLMK